MNNIYEILLEVVELLTFQYETDPKPNHKPPAQVVEEKTSEVGADEPDQHGCCEVSTI